MNLQNTGRKNMSQTCLKVQAMSGRADVAKDPAFGQNREEVWKSPLRTNQTVRRASPVLSGSMTVEAAAALPLFIFFMMNIIFALDMIRLQCNITAALQQAGNQICEYAFYTEYAQIGGQNLSSMIGSVDQNAAGAVSIGLTESFVRGKVNAYLGDMRRNSCLAGSISYLGSHIMSGTDGDVVQLVATYKVRPFFRVMGVRDFRMQSRYYGHAWTGYDVSHSTSEQDSEDTTVFVTEHGTVFHRSRSCTYLNPSISCVPGVVRERARNRDGGKYYRCPICKPLAYGNCIITDNGSRYHSRTSCPALKRSVRAMSLSDAEEQYAPCSKCGY